MVKLLVCLISAAVVAVVLLQLREQRIELNYQTNRLHNQIEGQQARLWNQQLQIAIYTAPNALAKEFGDRSLAMAPARGAHGGSGIHPTNDAAE